MNTDKMRRAAYETAIDNEDELFAAKDKAPLAMAAALVARNFPELLATVTQSTVNTALEAAQEADDGEGFHRLFTTKLEGSGKMDEMLRALAFVTRYVDGIATAAARRAMGSEEEDNFGAKFGRN